TVCRQYPAYRQRNERLFQDGWCPVPKYRYATHPLDALRREFVPVYFSLPEVIRAISGACFDTPAAVRRSVLLHESAGGLSLQTRLLLPSRVYHIPGTAGRYHFFRPCTTPYYQPQRRKARRISWV